jgi:hypothetical protein
MHGIIQTLYQVIKYEFSTLGWHNGLILYDIIAVFSILNDIMALFI